MTPADAMGVADSHAGAEDGCALLSESLSVITFWDGADEAWGLGNDIDGYWKIERVFEICEPREELHEDKFPVAYEMSLGQLSDLMQSRIDSW